MRARWRALWQALLQSGACTLVGAADRRAAGRGLIGDFSDREPQDVAHQQDRALPRRQVVKCCHKSKLGRLALVVERLRTRCVVGDTVQKGVRIRLELAPEDYDPFVVLWAWKMHVELDRLPQPRIVIAFDLRDRPKQKFWLLLQAPEPELCIKHPGYDEDLVITTDSRTLTLVHLGRLRLADAEREGAWQIDGSPALVRGMPMWGGLYSRFATIRPVSRAKFSENRAFAR